VYERHYPDYPKYQVRLWENHRFDVTASTSKEPRRFIYKYYDKDLRRRGFWEEEKPHLVRELVWRVGR